MRIKHPVIQIVILVVAASLIAVIANGFASRQRRLMLPGYYPNALKVPQRSAAPPPSIAAVTTTTTQPPSQSNTAPAQWSTAPAQWSTAAPGGAGAAEGGGAPQNTTTAAPAPAPVPAPNVAARLQPADGGLKPAAPPAPDPVAKFTPHPDKAYVEINGDDVAILHKAGALFLDARRTNVYEEGHIAGARSFSVWEADIDDKVNKLFEERSDPRDQNLPIVIYCSGGACEDSHMLSQKLWGIQFNNVYVYKDGFPDWQKRGGAVRTGSNP